MEIFWNPFLLCLTTKLFRIRIASSKKDKKAFTNLWHKIWLEEHYAEHAEPITQKYAKYDKFSVDLLVKFFALYPVGTMRLIWNNFDIRVPTMNDFEIKRIWRSDRIIEVTLLTVDRRFRRLCNFPFLVLIKALYWYSKRAKAEGLVIAADRRLFRLLTRVIKLPFVQIGQEKFYEGSITVPAYMPFDNFEEIFESNNPWLAKFIFHFKERSKR